MKKEDFVEFKIRSADILKAALEPQRENLPENPVFNFNIKLEHKINFEQNLVLVECNIEIFMNQKEEVGQFKAGCVFDVNDLEQYRNKENKSNADLPSNFVNTLNSITVSTVRGMMAVFFRGTYLHKAVLPIIDPTKFSPQKK